MIAWVDGAWVELKVRGGPQVLLSVLDGRTGPGVFETMGAVDGALPLWDRHMQRLERGARRLGIAWEPPPNLLEGALETLARNDQANGVLRLTLVPMAPARARWLAVARRRTGRTGPVRLVVVDDLQEPHGPPRDLKCTARDLYDRALARATAAEADDALLVEGDAVLETAVGNVFLRLNDQWVTPAADGRLLPGIARQVMLDGLVGGREGCVEKSISLRDVEAATSIVVTNAVHGPRAACVPGLAEPRPSSQPQQLVEIWRAALGILR